MTEYQKHQTQTKRKELLIKLLIALVIINVVVVFNGCNNKSKYIKNDDAVLKCRDSKLYRYYKHHKQEIIINDNGSYVACEDDIISF